MLQQQQQAPATASQVKEEQADDEKPKKRKLNELDIPYPRWVASCSSLNLEFEDGHGIVRKLATLPADSSNNMVALNSLVRQHSQELFELCMLQEAKDMLEL